MFTFANLLMKLYLTVAMKKRTSALCYICLGSVSLAPPATGDRRETLSTVDFRQFFFHF